MKLEDIYTHYNINEEKMHKLKVFTDLILNWNNKINLISRKSTLNIWERHILNSLQIIDCFSDERCNTILDIGSGGGFPGIVLAIMYPEKEFVLLDSCKKKTIVLSDIQSKLGLENIKVVCSRIEDLNHSCDIITARAVAPMDKILRLTQNIKYNRMLLLKGDNVQDELDNISKDYKYKLHSGLLGSKVVEVFI